MLPSRFKPFGSVLQHSRRGRVIGRQLARPQEGTLSPTVAATRAISGSSVETIVRVRVEAWRAASIEYAISGLPPRSVMFLPGICSRPAARGHDRNDAHRMSIGDMGDSLFNALAIRVPDQAVTAPSCSLTLFHCKKGAGRQTDQ